jgi:hypothetical protein
MCEEFSTLVCGRMNFFLHINRGISPGRFDDGYTRFDIRATPVIKGEAGEWL